MTLAVLAPVAGITVPLDVVPDPVFSSLMMGSGLAIDPGDGDEVVVCAPIGGTIAALHAHAFAVAAASAEVESAVLVHLGIDTVKLDGAGFEPLVAKGTHVTAGAAILRWSLASARAAGYSTLVPVVALSAPPEALTLASGEVKAGDLIFEWN